MGKRQNPRGNFFVIDREHFAKACELGLREAVCFLILAQGTGRDHRTTPWSAEGVRKRAGTSWESANQAIENLREHRLLERLPGKKIRWFLAEPAEDRYIWLPSSLAVGLAEEKPVLARIRESGSLSALKLLMSLYDRRDHEANGVLPRDMYGQRFDKYLAFEYGAYLVFGYNPSVNAPISGELANPQGTQPEDLRLLLDVRALQVEPWLEESAANDGELLHPLALNPASQLTSAALDSVKASLNNGVGSIVKSNKYLIPVLRHMKNVSLVNVLRLLHEPKTRMAMARWATLEEICHEKREFYRDFATQYGPKAIPRNY